MKSSQLGVYSERKKDKHISSKRKESENLIRKGNLLKVSGP